MFSASKSASVSSAYALTKSLRFRSSATAYLNRTPSTATNRRTWTWSAWVKRGKLSAVQELFDGYWANTDNGYFWVGFTSADAFEVQLYNSTLRTTTQVFRDPSAWYHLVLAVDTTQATAANRVKVYLNGSEITTFSTNNAPTQNLDTAVNYNGAHYIGSFQGTSNLFDGYQTDIYLIDGQQLTPSSFGKTDATTGQWSPAKYTGTYGTNGFHLTFSDATSTATLGYDTSGNSNNWTTNNISLTAGSTYDSMNDVPTLTSATVANYAVFNPLASGSFITLSNGNLTAVVGAGDSRSLSTIGMSSGKYFCEVTIGSTGCFVGIANGTASLANSVGYGDTGTYGYSAGNGKIYTNGVGTTYGATYTTSDVIGIAFDATNGTLTFYKNGTSQGLYSGISAGTYFFAVGNGGTTQSINFGQQPWIYSLPSGYLALNTYNLSAPTIAQGNKYMDATLYTGTLIAQSITNAGSFQPDLVWIKSRSAATDHKLTDSVRGVTKALISDTTGAETTDTLGLTAFNSNGFTISTDTNYNNSGATYVAWQWKAGGTAVTNTSGSITSSVSANTTSGFSVVTYTGTGSNATVGHGLGVAPSMVVVKQRTSASATSWYVYQVSLSSAAYAVYWNLTLGQDGPTALFWNNTAPTSSVFSIGTSSGVNASSGTYVAYCFAQIAGFSAFGSYTGNGSADGPFIYLGFRPAFIMIKVSSTTGNWCIEDNKRQGYNSVNDLLYPNGNYAEDSGSSYPSDFVSNGFKTRNTSFNASGATYIYMAFAENPFKYANAR